jgi:hypothetical protein
MLPEHHARLFFASFCFNLCFTICPMKSYGIGWSSGDRRLPYSPAEGARAASSSASPETGVWSPMRFSNAA